MNRRDVVSKIEGVGFKLFRHGGKHDIYAHADGRQIAVPRHRVLAPGTARRILKQAGVQESRIVKAKRKGATRAFTVRAQYLPTTEGGYTVAALNVFGVNTCGATFAEAREYLIDALSMMLESAPYQFGSIDDAPEPGGILEEILVLLPSSSRRPPARSRGRATK